MVEIDLNYSCDKQRVATDRSLITEYGRITMAHIRAHELTYAGRQVRVTQDSANMVEFLNGLLSNDLRAFEFSEKLANTHSQE